MAKRGQDEAEKQRKKEAQEEKAKKRGNNAISKEKTKLQIAAYEREMKDAQRKEAFAKVKQGREAAKDELNHPQII